MVSAFILGGEWRDYRFSWSLIHRWNQVRPQSLPRAWHGPVWNQWAHRRARGEHPLSLPWVHPPLDQSVPPQPRPPPWSPVLGPLDTRIDDPQTGEKTPLGTTLPCYFLPPARVICLNETPTGPPQLKILPWLPTVLGAKSKLLYTLEAQKI